MHVYGMRYTCRARNARALHEMHVAEHEMHVAGHEIHVMGHIRVRQINYSIVPWQWVRSQPLHCHYVIIDCGHQPVNDKYQLLSRPYCSGPTVRSYCPALLSLQRQFGLYCHALQRQGAVLSRDTAHTEAGSQCCHALLHQLWQGASAVTPYCPYRGREPVLSRATAPTEAGSQCCHALLPLQREGASVVTFYTVPPRPTALSNTHTTLPQVVSGQHSHHKATEVTAPSSLSHRITEVIAPSNLSHWITEVTSPSSLNYRITEVTAPSSQRHRITEVTAPSSQRHRITEVTAPSSLNVNY